MSSLLAFPGQGAQQPGMLHSLPDHVQVRACLGEASEALGEDVLQLDSAEALGSTRAVQLCLLIAGVACARLLPRPDYVAGLSIGAYPAAVMAGVLGFEDALRLVALRGELMQQAYPEGYGMTAIVGLSLATVEQLLVQVHSPEQPVYLANINAEQQVVIAGSHSAMAAVAQQAKALGAALARRLAVSVPSHCELLAAPAARLAEAFAGVTLQAPRVRYLSGSRARPLQQVEQLRDDLAYNMCRVVDWRGVVENAYERGIRLHIELPPGSVLTPLAKKVLLDGTCVAFQGARLDTLQALMDEEGRRIQ